MFLNVITMDVIDKVIAITASILNIVFILFSLLIYYFPFNSLTIRTRTIAVATLTPKVMYCIICIFSPFYYFSKVILKITFQNAYLCLSNCATCIGICNLHCICRIYILQFGRPLGICGIIVTFLKF